MQQYLDPAGITKNPYDIFIGGVRLADIPEVAERIIREQEAELRELIQLTKQNGLLGNLLEGLQTPTIQDYRFAFDPRTPLNHPALQRLGITDETNRYQFTTLFENSIAGYFSYLQTIDQDKAQFFLSWLDAHIKESDRQAHTYIVAGSRSGKSELLKILIHNYIKKGFSSLIILDPSGKLASEVAHFQNFTGTANDSKLIYFDPYLGQKNGVYPVINPFECTYKDLYRLDRATDELTRAINQILADTSSGFTDQMGLIVKRMISVLIYKGNGSFWDLLRFLNNEQNNDLIEIGKKHPNQAVREFFIYRFGQDKDLSVSISGIKTRIENLTSNTLFMRTTTGKSTIDLQIALDSRKYLIFNLSKGSLGENVSKYLGKLIVAQVQILSLQRQDRPPESYPPVHIFIDEMHNYITQSIEQILTESAKYKYYLTLANQYTGQSDRPTGASQFYTALLGNTWIKVIGKAGYDTIADMSREMGVTKDVLNQLEKGKFYVRVGNSTPFLLTASKRLLDTKHSMSPQEWEKLTAEQLRKYYRQPTVYQRPPATTQVQPPQEQATPKPPQERQEKQLYTEAKKTESKTAAPEPQETPAKKFKRKLDF